MTFPLSSFYSARHEFDSEQIPDLTKDVYIQDIHCVGSLCKLYFRELPNPLLTYQLYEKFSVSRALAGLNTAQLFLASVITTCLFNQISFCTAQHVTMCITKAEPNQQT